ncbi:MAG: type II toxin-antitoxin system HicB family antitoxin [Candidatus Omnitrophica bacterium]|nr:type II toxin-antitoxin system HicB family antitoxin [Candidatus Omnitrophota bacterium]MCA9428549.1 type II toxin-antitoxin system HicB family antitoxin [Candidatus Omnitrophota bacterium]MCA9431849.1 type II toxin-antitoxin system HicB family antitoxin [Candidatus Omnitrophota bacterium]MCB9769780.1 type II toxin-antitoxin system HicB family antitoxin [Candidatus Omnitrophota bacterium]MCB9783812.1 type II toxin-antitoxin system HicB family antitoxin [Candidatus Omnitrophota bacterium]
MKYTVILEEGETSFGAFVPDLPGCIAVGESRQETPALIKDAIEFHLEGLREDGAKIPAPHCTIETVDVESTVG